MVNGFCIKNNLGCKGAEIYQYNAIKKQRI